MFVQDSREMLGGIDDKGGVDEPIEIDGEG